MNRLLQAVLLLGVLSIPVWSFAEAEDPALLVQQTSEQVLKEVSEKKQELTNSPGRIYGLVDDIVLPRFDFTRMSRLVLGKYWRRATAEQQQAFIEQFRELLVKTYATALLNYTGQEIKYLPVRMVDGATEVTVGTEVSEAGAPPVPINYRLYLNRGDWQVYDVVIDGVSLVSNYRNSFSSQIRREQLSGLIAKLQERNRQDR